MTMILNIHSEVTIGKHKGRSVNDILNIDKKEIFNLIKQGLLFDDEVLSIAGIKKSVRDVKVLQVFVEHEKDNKKYEKETASLSKILKEIRTLDNIPEIDENENINQITQNTNNSNEYEEIDIDNI